MFQLSELVADDTYAAGTNLNAEKTDGKYEEDASQIQE